MKPAVLAKPILYSGATCTVACDSRCDKAWGWNGRPHEVLSDDVDDIVWLADDEIGTAPGPGETVGISEGDHVKPSAVPLRDGRMMNKWCSRECERATLVDAGDLLLVKDFSVRIFNEPWKHATQQAGKEP